MRGYQDRTGWGGDPAQGGNEVPVGEGETRRARRDPLDVAAAAVIVVLCVIAAATLREYAISNDEELQHQYSEMILAYYASGFTDRTLFGFRNLYLYGGLFDILAIGLGKLVPADIYLVRHALCAVIGIAGIGMTGATARLVAGPRAGLIAVLLLAVSGVWYGPMFNHTKDIPFAAAMIAATWALLRASRDLPSPRWRDMLALGLFAGAAGGQRAMALLFVLYVGLAIVMRLPRDSAQAAASFVGRAAPRFGVALGLAYLVMIAGWPWASLEPLNPLRAIFAFAHFHYEIRTILAGQIYMMSEVPRWYVPHYLAIKLPLALWAGALIALAAFALHAGRAPHAARRRREVVLLAVMVVFPVACQVIGRGPAFTGMRHFTFVVPPLAVLAAVGFDGAISWLAAQRRLLGALGGAALAAAIVWEAAMLWRLHPYEYLYYNALVGGLRGADGRYALDYWVNVMPEAVRRLDAMLDREERTGGPARQYTVGACAEPVAFAPFAGSRLKLTSGWKEADFFIAPTHMHCDRAADGKTVARIERLGVVIGVVKDRRALKAATR